MVFFVEKKLRLQEARKHKFYIIFFPLKNFLRYIGRKTHFTLSPFLIFIRVFILCPTKISLTMIFLLIVWHL